MKRLSSRLLSSPALSSRLLSPRLLSSLTRHRCVHPPPARTVKLNGNRTVTGMLRGFDQFMNLVLDETVEVVSVTHAPLPLP